MSEEEFNELKEKFNTLNNEIDKRIDLNIEIDKKNKIIFSLSALCILSIFASSFLYYKNLQLKKDLKYTSQELYKQDDKVNELEQEIAKLKKSDAPKQKQKIHFDFSNMPALPETHHHTYYYAPSRNIETPVYIPQEQKSSLPQNDFEAEQKERDLMYLKDTVQQLKEKELFDQMFPNGNNPYRIY
ncbi:MAG: hypothetical protein IKR34_02190 [Candidatus Gastranaerophilales bacterium]|nr:hypothetical protein [Elusimicrobiota bacterium]MBR6298033.1 hypothetical protein [Candidatus Gastranaerophilales bacterium]